MPDVIEAAGQFDRPRHIEFEKTKSRVVLKMRQIAACAGDQIIQAHDAVALRQQSVA